eukprot:7135624-Pyramimonas_sp.AAC.1
MPSRRGCANKLAKASWYAMTVQKHGVDLSSPKGAGARCAGQLACSLIVVASLTSRNGLHGPPP